MVRYYDKDGTPIEPTDWVAKFVDDEYRRVALDEREGIRVSTVWLGLNYQFGDGPPLIFETMVFFDLDKHQVNLSEDLPYRELPKDLTQERYSTLEEALEGHHAHVQRYLDIMDLL